MFDLPGWKLCGRGQAASILGIGYSEAVVSHGSCRKLPYTFFGRYYCRYYYRCDSGLADDFNLFHRSYFGLVLYRGLWLK
jgi:hypothetical protein